MPHCIFRKSDGAFRRGLNWREPPYDPVDEVALSLPAYPKDFEVWDGASGVRALTKAERMPALRAEAKAAVDGQAEAARLSYITTGAGQALVYEAKRQEAETWAASQPNPVLADYPFMRARAARLNGVTESAVTKAQMQTVAAEWALKADAWRAAGIAIEAEREGAKEAIDAAADQAAIDAAVAGLEWPVPA